MITDTESYPADAPEILAPAVAPSKITPEKRAAILSAAGMSTYARALGAMVTSFDPDPRSPSITLMPEGVFRGFGDPDAVASSPEKSDEAGVARLAFVHTGIILAGSTVFSLANPLGTRRAEEEISAGASMRASWFFDRVAPLLNLPPEGEQILFEKIRDNVYSVVAENWAEVAGTARNHLTHDFPANGFTFYDTPFPHYRPVTTEKMVNTILRIRIELDGADEASLEYYRSGRLHVKEAAARYPGQRG